MPMTGMQVLQNAVALMGGENGPGKIPQIQMDQALSSINVQLADLFGVNNALLAAKGENALGSAPVLAVLSDSLPICDELARNVMPYDVARDLGMPRGNPNFSYFAATYDMNKTHYMRGLPEDVIDCYGSCGK